MTRLRFKSLLFPHCSRLITPIHKVFVNCVIGTSVFLKPFQFPSCLTGDRTHFQQHLSNYLSQYKLVKTDLGFDFIHIYIYFFFLIFFSFSFFPTHRFTLGACVLTGATVFQLKVVENKTVPYVPGSWIHDVPLSCTKMNTFKSLNAPFCVNFNWRLYYVKIILRKKVINAIKYIQIKILCRGPEVLYFSLLIQHCSTDAYGWTALCWNNYCVIMGNFWPCVSFHFNGNCVHTPHKAELGPEYIGPKQKSNIPS